MTDEFENFKCFMQTELNLLHNLSIFSPENDVKHQISLQADIVMSQCPMMCFPLNHTRST